MMVKKVDGIRGEMMVRERESKSSHVEKERERKGIIIITNRSSGINRYEKERN